MKDDFRGFEVPTEADIKAIWKGDCTFVPDANVLLHLYRYPDDTRQELLGLLRKRRDENRLWLPHQAALEYHRNRVPELISQVHRYEDTCRSIRKHKDSLIAEFKSPFYPHLCPAIRDKFSSVTDEMMSDLQARRDACHALMENDPIRDEIRSIFEGILGKPYPKDRQDEIHREGEVRHRRGTPPGYLDDRFGDLTIWFQMIDQAKVVRQPVVFITDDQKDDWWHRFGGKAFCPRLELRQEMLESADVPFLMHTVDTFMRYAKTYAGDEVREESIGQVREVRESSAAEPSLREALASDPVLAAMVATARSTAAVANYDAAQLELARSIAATVRRQMAEADYVRWPVAQAQYVQSEIQWPAISSRSLFSPNVSAIASGQEMPALETESGDPSERVQEVPE